MGTALCWITLATYRLSLSGSAQRQLVLAPSLLAIAAFVPTGAILTFGTRADFTGSKTTMLSWGLIGLYSYSVAALFVLSPRAAVTSPLNTSVFVLVLLYWLTGGIANYYAALPVPRISFFLVPVLLVTSWRLRPRYRDAIAVLTYVSIATCVASLILALAKPSVAFTTPTRSVTFLFSDRLAGVFEHANAMGLFASIGLVLAWRAKGWTRFFGSPICGYCLIASDSRTSWFGCAAAISLLLAGARSSGERETQANTGSIGGWTPFRFFLGGSLVLLAALGISSYAARGGQSQGFTGRTTIWRFVLEHWREAPIIGHGPGIWSSLIAAGRVPQFAGQAHGQFFETLFTTGLVGVTLLAALLFAWTLKSVRAAQEGYWLPLALEVLIVAYGMLESPLSVWAIGGDIWLLSILLFLDPVSDAVRAPSTVRSKAYPPELSLMRRTGNI